MAILTMKNAGRRSGALRLLAAGGLGLILIPSLAGPSSAADFSNTAPITIPLPEAPAGCPPTCSSNTANPYPSPIQVSGLTGTVTDVNVTLNGLTYTESGPPDADIMVVAPGGKAVMIMSDACGTNDSPNPITTPITLTFDDQAAASLPADAVCSSGSFRPIDDDDDGESLPPGIQTPDTFPNAPAAPASTLALSTFNGVVPNGTWNLYVIDDAPNTPNANAVAGRIAGGWSLAITATADPTASTSAATNTTIGAVTSTTTRATATTRPATTATTRPATTATTSRIPTTGADTADIAVIGGICLLVGLSAVAPRLRRRWDS